MRRLIAIGVITLVFASSAFRVDADPLKGFVTTFACDNGQTYVINNGVIQQQSSVGFLVETTDVLVAKHFELFVDGELVLSWDRGIEGFLPEDLISCSSTFVIDGFTLEFFLTGFIPSSR